MNKTTVEYEEAPSGSVTFYNYKEPLMQFKGGHGYVGAVIFDTESGNIQCHFCGGWFKELGNHINREHALNAKEYKRQLGLNTSTALINEKIRAQLIEHGRICKKVLANLRPGVKRTQAEKDKIRNTLKENRDEMKNIRGTCPEQLIDRLVKLYDEKGYLPGTKAMKGKERISFYGPLIKTYGSLAEACRVAGIPERFPGQAITKKEPKYKRADVVKALYEYHIQNGSFKNVSKRLDKSIYGRYRTLIKKEPKEKDAILREALAYDGRYRRIDRIFKYSDEELLDFIRRFREMHGSVPSTSDCKRGLLPHASRYYYRFGSWRKALETAFPGESYPEQIKEVRKERYISPEWTLRQKFKKN